MGSQSLENYAPSHPSHLIYYFIPAHGQAARLVLNLLGLEYITRFLGFPDVELTLRSL